jgi:hypothetical protein
VCGDPDAPVPHVAYEEFQRGPRVASPSTPYGNLSAATSTRELHNRLLGVPTLPATWLFLRPTKT